MPSMTMYSNKGAGVYQGSPMTNMPGAVNLQAIIDIQAKAGAITSKNVGNAYLGFAMPPNIGKKRISSMLAYLHTEGRTQQLYGMSEAWATFEFVAVSAAWEEAAATYNAQPKGNRLPGGHLSQFAPGGWTQWALPLSAARQIFEYGLGIMVDGGATVDKNNKGDAFYAYGPILSGYDTANRPYLTIQYEDIVPTIEQVSPAAGYIDERTTVRFSWQFVATDAFLTNPVQRSATVQWRYKNGTTNTVSATTDSFVDIPFGTFATQSNIQWRVQVVSDDGITSAWTEWYDITTVDSAAGATAIRPSGQHLERDRPHDFTWRHASPTGTAQSRAELQVSYNKGQSWQALANVTGSEQTVTIAANALTTGAMRWRVRTYNTQGVSGEWSEPLDNTVVAPPLAPIINTVDGSRARPYITWQSADQAIYNLQIVSADGVVEDAGVVLDSGRGYQVQTYLPNGQYAVRLCVSNAYGYWSAWSEQTWTVAAAKPGAPAADAATIRYGVRISVTDIRPEVQRIYIYRRQRGVTTRIAALEDGERNYADYRVAGAASYIVRVIDGDDNFADAAPVQAVAGIPRYRLLLAPAARPWDVLEIYQRVDAGASIERSRSLDNRGELIQYEGRRSPVMEYGEGEQRTMAIAATLGREDWQRLEAMVRSKETLLIRDADGEVVYCATQTLDTPNDRNRRYRRALYDVDLPLVEVEVDEEAAYA